MPMFPSLSKRNSNHHETQLSAMIQATPPYILKHIRCLSVLRFPIHSQDWGEFTKYSPTSYLPRSFPNPTASSPP